MDEILLLDFSKKQGSQNKHKIVEIQNFTTV